jgi:hypothetical protein
MTSIMSVSVLFVCVCLTGVVVTGNSLCFGSLLTIIHSDLSSLVFNCPSILFEKKNASFFTRPISLQNTKK